MNHALSRLRQALSLRANLSSLFIRKGARSAPLDGIRALSILWVIAFHAVAQLTRLPRTGAVELFARGLRRGYLGVDVFFVLSGYLIATLLFAEREQSGTISFPRFYARRALRILPAYYLTLVLVCALISTNCDAAWANVLYVNNFLPSSRQCMDWSWSLAIEEQFYLVFPAFIVLLYSLKTSHRRLALLTALFLLGIVIRAAIVDNNGLQYPSPDHDRLYVDTLYDKPQARYSELLSGVIAAFLARETDFLNRLRAHANIANIGVALSLFAIGFTALNTLHGSGDGWTSVQRFAFYTFSTHAFSASVAFLLLVCAHGIGAGRALGRILSAKFFFPIAQLSYSAYLLHVIFVKLATSHQWFPPATTVAGACLYTLALAAVTLTAATAMFLCIEKPFMNLRRANSETTH